ncbi:MAG: hypothetical protein HQL31_07405 [Planctomycetes bacterium]|nr:hypothetical protein [Planctomycetota bacterium]
MGEAESLLLEFDFRDRGANLTSFRGAKLLPPELEWLRRHLEDEGSGPQGDFTSIHLKPAVWRSLPAFLYRNKAFSEMPAVLSRAEKFLRWLPERRGEDPDTSTLSIDALRSGRAEAERLLKIFHLLEEHIELGRHMPSPTDSPELIDAEAQVVAWQRSGMHHAVHSRFSVVSVDTKSGEIYLLGEQDDSRHTLRLGHEIGKLLRPGDSARLSLARTERGNSILLACDPPFFDT